MKIPYIIEEFKNNSWIESSRTTGEVYARAQYETLISMRKTVRCIYDGKVIWSN